MSLRDTIAAISTAPGRGGIGVVRVSGVGLSTFARAITGRDPAPRRATISTFVDADGTVIDEGIALFFPAPASYTGQDVLELQGHGGPVVMSMLLRRCVDLGARLAEPGEFTRRAYANGKLDLAQAEGVIDLIDAATTQAARSALRSLRGEFSAEVQALNRQIIELRALVEATLDFPEEEVELPATMHPRVRLRALCEQLDRVLLAARQGSILREGVHIALAGVPNVGKSSLLNRLAGEDLAIVTEVPGTTRDTIRQAIDLAGVPVHIIDTAGLRNTEDTVERIGVERAWNAIRSADLVLLVTAEGVSNGGVSEEPAPDVGKAVTHIRVVNKIDLTGRAPGVERAGGEQVVWVSAKTGAGIGLLRNAIVEAIGWTAAPEGTYFARERHLSALREAANRLSWAAAELDRPDLLAEELRLAHLALGSIVGEFSADDLLGEIFSRFCIGK